MYDVCRKSSFDALEGWLQEVCGVPSVAFRMPLMLATAGVQVRSKCDENAVIVLVGNKVDMEGREVSYETAASWAQRAGLTYMETSAKRDIMINEAFITLGDCSTTLDSVDHCEPHLQHSYSLTAAS